MNLSLRSLLVLALLLLGTPLVPWAATPPEAAAQLRDELDQIVGQSYPDDGPGAAVIVMRGGETLYRGAHGLANLELAVPLRADSVFRIGSVTKQFTAAAILLLAEQRKLQLSDTISRHLPDYHTQGRTVTIEHLLAHTSGIANYTEIPEWYAGIRNEVSAAQLIQLFQDKPFDFAPGQRWKYDNSGYILLGAIIEKLSGQSYADFMRTQIFEPLGMNQTGYENLARITPGRAAGYMRDGNRWRNADFLSMTQPFAAGALTSTVDDLARWNAAISTGKLLTASSWQRATASFVLDDGTPTRYGAGWIIGRVGPIATVEHGGGINGFNAYVLRAPLEDVYVAVLTNASPPRTPPQDVAVKLAALALGVSLDSPENTLPARRLDEYVGRYLLADGRAIVISREGDRLHVGEGPAERITLVPIGRDLFEERAQHARYAFQRESHQVTGLEIEPRILISQRARRAPAAR